MSEKERKRITAEQASACYFAALLGPSARFFELERLQLLSSDDTFEDVDQLAPLLIQETRRQLDQALRLAGH